MQERELRGTALRFRQQRTRDGAYLGVRVAGHRRGITPPGPAGQRRHDSGQRRAHLRGVHVDPGQIGRPARRPPRPARPGSAAGAPATSSRPTRAPTAAPRPHEPLARPGPGTRAATRAAERSRPVMARPASVACTCASTNPGTTSAPSRSITRSGVPATATACSPPIQEIVAPSIASAVASGSAAVCTRPLRSSVSGIDARDPSIRFPSSVCVETFGASATVGG